MRFYKKEWQEKPDDEARKQTATQMASSTKNWVSSLGDKDQKEEDTKDEE